jgi:hypothetical protein
MALPSLALGIGLQGQYDYKHQAALDLARAKGRAKAEADEAAARAKKLAPIERRLQRITGEGLLPVHAKAMKQKVMETIDYMQDNPEDLGGVTQRLYDIEATQGAFKTQADLIKKTQTSSYLQGDADAVSNIMSSDSPDVIEESLSINPSTGIRYDKASNNFAVAPTKYINSSTRIDNILQKGGSNYYMPTEEEKIIDVNGRKFASFDLNPNVADVVLSEMLTGDNLASANDDYYSYLKRNRKGLPNLRSPEGIAEFEAGRDKFLKDQIAGELTVRGLLRDVTPAKDRNIYISNNMPSAVDENATFEPGGAVNLSYSADPGVIYSATPLAGNALGNFNGQFPYTNTTFDMKTGAPIPKVGNQNSTFNRIDSYYVLSTDVTFNGVKLKKGMIIPDEAFELAKKNGVLDVKTYATGKENKDGGKSFYTEVPYISDTQLMEATPKDRAIIKKAQEIQKQKLEELKTTMPKPERTGSSVIIMTDEAKAIKEKIRPSAKATPLKPSGAEAPVKDRNTIVPNANAKAEDKENSRRTVEAQRAKDELKKRLAGNK